MNNSIKPGVTWTDTEGKRIHAHGGSVYYENGVYYWYGENKEKTTGSNGIWHWGVRCYSSTDLYNWEDRGLIIQPDTENENSPLHPTAQMDRPHIIYNKKTGKYVCWVKVMNRPEGQAETVLTADSFLGPYTIVNVDIKPMGMSAGDFDLAVDEVTGKAYYYFEKVHTETICAELNEEYTDVTGVYSSHFQRPYPPFVREATAHFLYEGKHYLITSGTTGYLPNPSEIAVSEDWHGPYKELGNPHIGDETDTSFHSQISSVFKVQGKKNLFIACADRWVPDLMDMDYHIYKKFYEAIFSGHREDIPKIAEAEGMSEEQLKKVFGDVKRNTSIADYVWLPIRFEKSGEDASEVKPVIYWCDEWKIEDFE